ncbi:MAG: hypothetical protein FJ096_22210 [Deltaproteobacteria bacterium]|nr:hypothetical protein [Deltaproteobacteria bacterium]
MNLRTVHQILIVAAGGLASIFALRSLWLFSRGGGTLSLGITVASASFGFAMVTYLRRFRAKLQAGTARPASAASKGE